MGLERGTIPAEAPAPNREPISIPEPSEAPAEPIETPATTPEREKVPA